MFGFRPLKVSQPKECRVDHALSIHRVAIHRVATMVDVESDIQPTDYGALSVGASLLANARIKPLKISQQKQYRTVSFSS
jgi:hypothetical protein